VMGTLGLEPRTFRLKV